jgi:hypothetical protein
MHIGSTEFLEIIAQQGRYLLLERAVPRGRLKRDMITIKEHDGRDLVLGVEGYTSGPVELPIPIFEDFIRTNLVAQDGPENMEQGTVFRLTESGLKRGSARFEASEIDHAALTREIIARYPNILKALAE